MQCDCAACGSARRCLDAVVAVRNAAGGPFLPLIDATAICGSCKPAQNLGMRQVAMLASVLRPLTSPSTVTSGPLFGGFAEAALLRRRRYAVMKDAARAPRYVRKELLCRGSLHISTAPSPILNAKYSSRCAPQDNCGSRGDAVDEDGEPRDDSFSESEDRERAGGANGASRGDGGGPMSGCPPRRAPVGSQGVLSLDLLGRTGWNALCLVPNSILVVGCVLLRCSSDAMIYNRGSLPQRLR